MRDLSEKEESMVAAGKSEEKDHGKAGGKWDRAIQAAEKLCGPGNVESVETKGDDIKIVCKSDKG